MVKFALFLTYEGEDTPRKIADGCTKQQLLDVLSRHLLLAEVSNFLVVPFEYDVPFKEFTL